MEPHAELARIVATLHALIAGAGALRAVLLLDRGEDAALVVDCTADGSSEVADGSYARELPPADWLDASPLPLPSLRPPPKLEVDLAEMTVASPLGVLDAVARAVRDTAGLFPGQSVLAVGWETNEPEAPLFLACRGDDPLVLSLGDAEYELERGWPG